MPIKTEELEKEILQTLITEQETINSITFNLGQIHLQLKELKSELQRYGDREQELELQYDNSVKKINEILTSLNQKYKNGDIDLENGTITFEEN